MRIGYLTSRYPAVSHTFIRREVAAVRARGIDVHTFAVRHPATSELRGEDDRAELARTWAILPARPWKILEAHAHGIARRPRSYARTLRRALKHRMPGMRSALWAGFHFAEAIYLARELERRGIEHLHSHFANSGGTIGFLATQFLDIGWSQTLHGNSDFQATATALLREKIASARFTACVSHFGRALAMHASDPSDWDRVILSRCGIDLRAMPKREDPARREAGRRLRVLTVGRLAPEKGQIGLVRAFADVVAQGIDAELRIVGEGPERARIEAEVERLGLADRCALPGSASDVECIREMQEADLFVLTSFMEGLPVVLMEAMAVGTAVIAPRLAGIPELVEEGCGLLYTPAHRSELAERMVRLLRDPDLRARLGEAGQRRVMEEFVVERAVEPLVERFSNVA